MRRRGSELGARRRRRGCQRIEAAAGVSDVVVSDEKRYRSYYAPRSEREAAASAALDQARGAALVVGDCLRVAIASVERAKGKGSNDP